MMIDQLESRVLFSSVPPIGSLHPVNLHASRGYITGHIPVLHATWNAPKITAAERAVYGAPIGFQVATMKQDNTGYVYQGLVPIGKGKTSFATSITGLTPHTPMRVLVDTLFVGSATAGNVSVWSEVDITTI